MRRDDRDDRDDPLEDLFDQLEQMMNDVMGQGNVDFDVGFEAGPAGPGAGFGADTHVDVHETDDQVRVVADIPGVDKEAIDLKCDGEVLTIRARAGDREYDDRVTLPTRVDEHSATATYNNGVLEVAFDRADDSADIDLR
jgi:HSP20 family protein